MLFNFMLKPDFISYSFEDLPLKKRKTKNIVYGVDTTSKSRDIMMSMLPDIVQNEAEKLVSPNIQQDIQGIQRKKNNKIEPNK